MPLLALSQLSLSPSLSLSCANQRRELQPRGEGAHVIGTRAGRLVHSARQCWRAREGEPERERGPEGARRGCRLVGRKPRPRRGAGALPLSTYTATA